LENDVALPRRREPCNGPNERRLTHPISAEDDNDLARANLQIDAMQDVAVAVIGVDAPQGQKRR
jgi:hypothetical protein